MEIATTELTALELEQRLKNASRPHYAVIGARRQNTKETSLSRHGEFIVFPSIGKASRLRPPIDWNEDPFRSRSWQAQLHTLRFLDVLFSRYRSKDDLPALRFACDIALDWISANKRESSQTSKMAWFDKVVGDRAPFIGYLFRAAVYEKILSDSETERLFESSLDHIEYLLDDSQYVNVSNHGLSQDIGLVVTCDYLDFLSEAAAWRRKGIDRFVETLSRHVATGEGVYLEHSPAYQWLVVGLVRRFRQLAAVEDDRLHLLLDALERASGWLVLPDGRTPPMGDSDLVPAPPWAKELAQQTMGMRVFPRAGIASVRSGTSMLLVTSGYHSHVHKHADELSFCLFEAGQLVLAEGGKYGYDDEDIARQYALSSAAHNVLVVDRKPFSIRDGPPYGGAIQRAGQAHGWYAVEGCNPLLKSHGVSHCRLFAYRPGDVLIIADFVEAPSTHQYTRLFHFAPGVDVTRRANNAVGFSIGRATGVLRDASGTDSKLELDIAFGQTDPVLSGWCFPQYRDWQSVATVALTTSAQSPLITIIPLGDDSWHVEAVNRKNTFGLRCAQFQGPGQSYGVEIVPRGADGIAIDTCCD